MQDIKSRDRFIEEVVNSITSSDGQDEAFIFGISGKWGEGKTFFLKKLKIELEKSQSSKMKVIELNPWKYARDDDSILRELLRQILKLHTNSLRRWWLNRKLQGLYHDVSKKKINWLTTFFATVLLAGLWFLYKYPPDFLKDAKDLVQTNKALATLLLIPVLLGLANAITTSQSSTKAVATRDKFDELFNDLMNNLGLDKVVVYVDDLDRLTASKAVSVLDSLRTFFDKNKLVFIVASDHTVLERHLGYELKPHAQPPEQMEEGRRFLKKIFNVYWRLPLPTKPEFEVYVKSLVDKEANPFLHEKLLNPSNRKSFREYLLEYFSNNFRNTERFVNRVEFTFKLIDTQHTARTTSQRNKEYFGEMLENPLLVIRVLLIEEMANPLFEKIQHTPELILSLERHATAGDTSSELFEQTFKELSDEQKSFIRSFIVLRPRFHDETGIKVKSIEPYIYLSSDSSFGDIRGLSPKEFSTYLHEDRTSDLVAILSRSGEQKISEAINAFATELAGLADVPAKEKLLASLIKVAVKADPKLPAQSIIVGSIVNYDFSFVDQLESANKIKMFEELGSLNFDATQFTVVLENTPNFTQTEWAAITALDDGLPVTPLTQYKFLRYFKDYFASNPGDAISQLGPRIDKFDTPAVNATLQSFISQLITYFINDNNDTRRHYGIALLRKTDSGYQDLLSNLREQLGAKNANIFNWLATLKNSSEPLFTKEELVEAVIDGAQSTSGVVDLNERLTMFLALPEAKDALWEALLTRIDINLLIDALYESVTLNNYLPLAPTSEIANRVLEAILRRFINQENVDSPEASSWLTRIAVGHWLFTNLKLEKSLVKLINSRLNTQYLGDHARQNLERLKSDFQEA